MLQQHYGKPPSELSKSYFVRRLMLSLVQEKWLVSLAIGCKTNIAEVGSDWLVSILW